MATQGKKRGQKIVEMVKNKTEATNLTRVDGIEVENSTVYEAKICEEYTNSVPAKAKDVPVYTNLLPVTYIIENEEQNNDDPESTDQLLLNDIYMDSELFSASASTSADKVFDSDDSVKDPDFIINPNDAEIAESISDIAEKLDMSVLVDVTSRINNETAASTGAKTSINANTISKKGYTKKGEVRKRRTFEKSLKERQKDDEERQRKKHEIKHYQRPDCKKCPRKCKEFSNDHRSSINSQYWTMTWQERRIFISSNVSIHDVKRRRGSVKTTRNRTFKYFLKNENGEKLEVCKSFFLTTLGYDPKNDRIITNVMTKEKHASIRPSTDMRGKHAKTPKTDRDVIKSHVESFAPTVSHYRREHAPNKRYLPSDLTIKTMHADFKTLHPNIKCSYELYRKCVSKDFNISFTKLGHEECEICEGFKLHNPDHTETLLSEECSHCQLWKRHIQKSKESREKYKSDANYDFSLSTVCFSADLEKVIMLPRIDMFKRVVFCQRIIVFNESFVPVGTKQKIRPLACLWHECTSGRKKEDLISTFHAFILHMRDKENIIIWLDNCAGQNKNWTLFSFLVYIINSQEISAQKITFRYFEPGHTFMSADSFHHQVEQSLQRMKKVYDFTDFVNCVQSSNSGKVDVKVMNQDNFFVWPDNSSIYKINNANPRPYLKDIVEVTAKRDSYVLFYKTSFTLETPMELNFLKMKLSKGRIQKPKKIPQLRGIKQERKQMILNNLSQLIPENRRHFWVNLPVNDDAVDLRTDYDEA